MQKIVKIKGGEYAVPFFRFREKDFSFGNRDTVLILTELSYAEVVDLFSEPGEWSVANGEIVTDCTDYCKLLSIKDTRTGVLEVVLSKMTDGEILAELREALEA